jgi:hypothetical protein
MFAVNSCEYSKPRPIAVMAIDSVIHSGPMTDLR